MPFPDLPQLLHPTSPLPTHIDLGKCSCSWQGGVFDYDWSRQQDGFRELTREEVAQLMRKLQAASHLLLLNLYLNPSVGGQLHICMPALTNLQVLSLNSCIDRSWDLGIFYPKPGSRSKSIDDNETAALAQALPKLQSLLVLDMGSNRRIGSQGWALLLPSLAALTALQVLRLDAINFRAAGMQSLAPSLLHLTALQQLHLTYNDIGAAGMQSVAPSLLHLTALQQLHLNNNKIGAVGMQSLAMS